MPFLYEELRLLQGNDVGRDLILLITDAMMQRDIAIGNIASGNGGRLLQTPDRDNFCYAIRATTINRVGVLVMRSAVVLWSFVPR